MAQIVKPKEEGGVGVSRASNSKAILTFKSFADELRDDLNDSITDTEVIEMLAQHLITKPVFDALFEDYSFAINIEAVYHSNMKGYDAAPTGSGRPVRAHDPCGAGTGALPRAGMNQAVGLDDSPAPPTPTSGPPKPWATPSIRWNCSCEWSQWG